MNASEPHPSTRKAVIFGAGAAGKGLLGLLFAQAGYRITFVDRLPQLVECLHRAGGYRVRVHRLAGGADHCEVSGLRILPAEDRTAVARAIVEADFVLTAVFGENLPDVAHTLALGIDACRAGNRQRPLHCIACENMKQGSTFLKQQVLTHLGPDSSTYLEQVVGFPNAMINRVVPVPGDPLVVETEDYCEWTIDAGEIRGAWPAEIDFIERVQNQAARLERKLFVYNGAHAACAYFGAQQDCYGIHQALQHPDIAPRMDGVLRELADAVRAEHAFSESTMESYIDDFRRRCMNPGMQDAVARIARHPIRKLGRSERLIGPAILAAAHDLPRSMILQAAAAALAYRDPNDPESLELGTRLERDGIQDTLSAVCGLEPVHPLWAELLRACLPADQGV